MSLIAKIYVSAIVVIGAAFTITELAHWGTQDFVRFLCYFALAIMASRLKVSLPGITGALSVLFIFILFAIVELSLPEALLIGCSAILMQCLWNYRQRPKWHQVLFNLGSMAITVVTAGAVYHSGLLIRGHLEPALRLMVTATAFFVMNTFPVAGAIALTERRSLRRVWRECYVWSFPYYLLGAIIVGAASAVNRHFGWQTASLGIPIVYLIYRSYYLYLGRMEDGKKHAEEMAELHLRTIEALALAIEAKDNITDDHLRRVQIFAVEVGRELGLDESQLEALRAAAVLHDIGILAVPEHIISKPGKLTREEFEKMKIHPVVGAEILEQVRFPYAVAPIVRSHHEKWDGSGYPDGLAGEQIPIGARILSAVDCLDALASDRQYRRALPLDEAIKIVEQEAGKAFDPRVVEVLARRYVELENKAKSSGQGEKAKLSTDARIERGASPAAGFENTRKADQTGQHSINPDLANQDLTKFSRSIREARLESAIDALGQCRDRREAFAIMREEMGALVHYDALAIYERAGDHLRPAFLYGDDYNLFSSLEIPLGSGLSGWVAENRKPIVNGNPSVEPGYLNDPQKFSTLRSALAVPLETRGGIQGVLSLYHQDRDAFTERDRELTVALGAKLAAVMETTRDHVSAETPAIARQG